MDDQTTSASTSTEVPGGYVSTSSKTLGGEDTGRSENHGQKRSTGRTLAYVAAAILGVAAIGALIFSGANTPESSTSEAGNFGRFADMAFVTIDGDSSNLGEYAGEPLVVNFFASWCGPCRAEMPHFESASLSNGDDVKFLGINHDIEDSSWKAFVAETEVTFETVFQPGTEIWTEIDAIAMPTTAFVSPEGEVLYVYAGVLDEATLQSLIDEHLLENA